MEKILKIVQSMGQRVKYAEHPNGVQYICELKREVLTHKLNES